MGGDAPSIADLVEMRPWKQVLLTTYTLSLSYFESEILRRLQRGGCSEIWVLADAEGYRSSLLERRSMRVGQEYRLIPVALPDGVFHPKCIYLAGDEGDLLLIGSGNVTFAGHGRNSEVFEALSPDLAATAFREFADFLEAVGSRPDIVIPRANWVDEFASRARWAADNGSDQEGVPPVRLVHPVNEPIINQLPTLLAEHGACLEAVVMSPYHDRDGAALLKLVEELGIASLNVAVTKTGASPFPFEQTDTWIHPVSPVRPHRKDNRFVHAKWFEFGMDTAKLLLTGSINATRKALTTSDNVELGVLRCLPADSKPLTFDVVGRPTFEPQERMPSGLKGNEIVYAAFDRDDPTLLRGQVISLQSVEGLWLGRVIQADGEASTFDALVKSDGNFAVLSSALEHFYEMPALQVILSKGEREARGWVHNEMLLALSGRRRLTAGALSRLMRREGSDDDIEALLDYLGVYSEQHLHLFDRPVQKSSEGDDGRHSAERSFMVDLVELAPGVDEGSDVVSSAGTSPSTPDQFDIAMTRLRRMLLGNGRAKSAPLGHSPGAALAEELVSDGGEQTVEDRSRKIGLSDFELEMASLIEDAADKPHVLRGLLVMEYEVVLSMRIHHLGDLDGAHDFLHSWFTKACRVAEPEQGRLTSIQQHVVTAAAALFRLAGNSTAMAAQLHDNLEQYFGRTVDFEEALGSLVPNAVVGAAGLLSGADDASLADALLNILSQRTTRQQLTDALALAVEGKGIPTDWEVFRSPLGAELHYTLAGENWRNRVREALGGLAACAFDYYSFSATDAAAYAKVRIARCIHCRRFTVNTRL